jgi:leucyl-tRNA synthetase
MKLLNTLDELPRLEQADIQGKFPRAEADFAVMSEGFSILLRLLSPITPHISQALWKELGYGDDILSTKWPVVDEEALVQNEIELVVQVNGKLRGNIRIAKDADKSAIETAALANPDVQKHVAGLPPKKVIVVPGRLVNIVV